MNDNPESLGDMSDLSELDEAYAHYLSRVELGEDEAQIITREADAHDLDPAVLRQHVEDHKKLDETVESKDGDAYVAQIAAMRERRGLPPLPPFIMNAARARMSGEELPDDPGEKLRSIFGGQVIGPFRFSEMEDKGKSLKDMLMASMKASDPERFAREFGQYEPERVIEPEKPTLDPFSVKTISFLIGREIGNGFRMMDKQKFFMTITLLILALRRRK